MSRATKPNPFTVRTVGEILARASADALEAGETLRTGYVQGAYEEWCFNSGNLSGNDGETGTARLVKKAFAILGFTWR